MYPECMRLLRLAFSFTLLFSGCTLLAWFLFLPVIGAVAFLSPKILLITLAGISGLSFLFVLSLSEWGTLRLYRGQLPRSFGLRNSYEMAQSESPDSLKSRPALMLYPDPVPNVFVLRSLFGKGLFLLSDGFISILDEEELRFVLRGAIKHLGRPEVVIQSSCIFALTLIQRSIAVPRQGVSVRRAIRMLLLYPWETFFRWLGYEVTGRVGQASNQDFVRGASKLARAEQLYGQQAFLPGLVYLGIRR